MALDDSYLLMPDDRRSASVAAIETSFFELGLDSCEIAYALGMYERQVARVLHALRNERRRAKAKESA
jgi:DNA-binding transcriptional regulator LsrR (DeoR family)